MSDALIIIAGIIIGVLISSLYKQIKENTKLRDKLDEIRMILFNAKISDKIKEKVAKVLDR